MDGPSVRFLSWPRMYALNAYWVFASETPPHALASPQTFQWLESVPELEIGKNRVQYWSYEEACCWNFLFC
ncbi:hypothetical protein JHK82_018852 [Glycine max]|uniref:Uncharacterized protein n=2 Tax=Glycine subgen. Soja TaxID=1462606 RepID=K7L268_SOYBN|nr:hypothetical protein JHK87_018741 [Glycine soja]KAG5022953.1 hypothetical protein JHK85_019295 [Glycine max]KAG5038035.1 hypothetical protein JHK86_018875 [Glycine max]KAG5143157.1 hypothetical protein JHK82_018852 [Glycine max]KAH1087192.1 hypothetical protein GYH30_018646 [Glycine max]